MSQFGVVRFFFKIVAENFFHEAKKRLRLSTAELHGGHLFFQMADFLEELRVRWL
jgi:hypothetical protein